MKRLTLALWLVAAGCNCSNATIQKTPEVCDNGRDDDQNGLVDCADGACFLDSHCFASCLDECAGDEALCDSAGVRVCVKDTASGCRVFASASSCGTGSVCSGGVCMAPPCTDQCTSGAKQCAGLGLPVHCDTLATGCTDWVVDTPCGSGDACSAGTCVPRTQCVSDCPSVGATRCTPDGKQQTCEGVPACHQWGLPVPCSGGSCSCVPDSGSGGGAGGGAGGGTATGGGTGGGGGGSGAGGGSGGGSASVTCVDGGSGCAALQMVAYEEGGCAALESGVLECWGELNDVLNPGSHPPTPIAIPFDAGYTLEGGQGTTCVRQGAGEVYCWGRQVLPMAQPTDYPTLDPGTQSVVGGPTYLCALRDDGGVECWGGGVTINDGTLPDAMPFPEMVATPSRVAGFGAQDELSLGAEVICGRRDRTLTCWGYNSNIGQCPMGDQQAVRLPGFVEPQTHYDAGISAFVVHDRGVCVSDAQGAVSCWGDQLGEQSFPVFRSCTANAIPGFAAPVTQLCSGGQFACALESTGQVACWGEGYGLGILGTAFDAGMGNSSNLPIPIGGLSDVRKISCGAAHVCALSGDARVRCWGRNEYYGALGIDDAGFVFSAVPVVVPL